MNGKPPKFTSPWKTTPSPQFDAKPIYRKEFAPPFGVALGSQTVAYRLPTKWLCGGLGVALRWLCTPESMPSICLLYGFVVALGGFDGQFQLKPKRESARLAKTLHALASLS
jgi:hypothetical protein